MEEAFEKLKEEGKTDVESLIKWMKDSKIIEDTKSAEDKARALFSECADKQNVELNKFKEVVDKLASEQKKTLDDFYKSLVDHGPRLKNALMAGASAFKDALMKK